MLKQSSCLAILLASLLWLTQGFADARDSSTFGEIAIPDPAKPADAEQCVKTVDVMRRDHMKLLDHQRDRTVIDGERGSKYSLVGCMNCHNPASAEKVVRYEDPEHFCADCHRYASVKIDCFECHADRGLQQSQQSSLEPLDAPWRLASDVNLTTLHQRSGAFDDD